MHPTAIQTKLTSTTRDPGSHGTGVKRQPRLTHRKGNKGKNVLAHGNVFYRHVCHNSTTLLRQVMAPHAAGAFYNISKGMLALESQDVREGRAAHMD